MVSAVVSAKFCYVVDKPGGLPISIEAAQTGVIHKWPFTFTVIVKSKVLRRVISIVDHQVSKELCSLAEMIEERAPEPFH